MEKHGCLLDFYLVTKHGRDTSREREHRRASLWERGVSSAVNAPRLSCLWVTQLGRDECVALRKGWSWAFKIQNNIHEYLVAQTTYRRQNLSRCVITNLLHQLHLQVG